MIGIVTVQWNSSELTIKFLESISTHLSDDVSLVIIDNGSDKAHLDRLKEELANKFNEHVQADNARITLIENQENSGYARANNIGINYFLEQNKLWIWLLNNDCQLKDDTVDQLITTLKTQSPGLFGTKILDSEEKTETFGGYVFNKWTSHYNPVKRADLPLLDKQLFYISGASLLSHRELFEKCGLLNESTFLYFEEIDFCLRAKKDGYKIDVLEKIEISHLGSGSSDKPELKKVKTYHETWSTLHFYSMHQKQLFPLVLTLRTIIKIISLIVKSRGNEVKSVIEATIHFLENKNKDLAPTKITNITHY